MAKQTKLFNLEQGEGKDKIIIPVPPVKTATKRYFDRLIEDYRNLNILDGREVTIVRVVPQFS